MTKDTVLEHIRIGLDLAQRVAMEQVCPVPYETALEHFSKMCTAEERRSIMRVMNSDDMKQAIELVSRAMGFYIFLNLHKVSEELDQHFMLVNLGNTNGEVN